MVNIDRVMIVSKLNLVSMVFLFKFKQKVFLMDFVTNLLRLRADKGPVGDNSQVDAQYTLAQQPGYKDHHQDAGNVQKETGAYHGGNLYAVGAEYYGIGGCCGR